MKEINQNLKIMIKKYNNNLKNEINEIKNAVCNNSLIGEMGCFGGDGGEEGNLKDLIGECLVYKNEIEAKFNLINTKLNALNGKIREKGHASIDNLISDYDKIK